MPDVQSFSSDVAFTPAVKAIQTRKGSRDAYARTEENGGWRTEIDENLAAFLAETNSFYFATATAEGQPYIQHRGGPKGFVKIVDKNTIAFADYAGNRQYITQGNLTENRQGLYLCDGLRTSPARQDLGRGARGGRRSSVDHGADAERLQGAARTSHSVQDLCVGHQLPAAHPAKVRRRRRGAGAGLARRPHCRA